MLKSIIESILFISNRPLTLKELANLTKNDVNKIKEAINELIKKFENENSGIRIINVGSKFQMVTNPKNAPILQKFLKTEINKDLTPASLETLSVITYRGPISKNELEQIRGVNCSVILRHLLIRGLIEEIEEEVYQISLDFLRHLGVNKIEELPDWDKFNREISWENLVSKNQSNSSD